MAFIRKLLLRIVASFVVSVIFILVICTVIFFCWLVLYLTSFIYNQIYYSTENALAAGAIAVLVAMLIILTTVGTVGFWNDN